jgi:hypothetical protein
MEVRLIAAALLFVSAAFSNSHVEAQNALTQIAENALEGPDAVLKSRNSGRVCIQIANET